jgi:orotidine 5'-phosphate decarboxylase subfamily 2
MTDATSFRERFDAAVAGADSLLCVGLDPHPDRTAAADIRDACLRVIDRTAPYAAVYKPNSAFFERAGAAGFAALADVIAHAPPGRLMLLDAKRGDMASTARSYAQAAFEALGADALTVSPYLGADSIAPFVADPTRGAFLLCHTSNPGATDLQELDVGGEPLFLRVARVAAGWSEHANVGLVVGATFPDALARVRAAAPDLPILVPGVGAQGGSLEDSVAAGLDGTGGGLIVSSSRSIFYHDDPAAAARAMRDALARARDARVGARVP